MVTVLDEVTKITSTSVEDGILSIKHETSLDVLRDCLERERTNRKRTTLIKAIEVRIRKLEREEAR